jgi:hypothetical protein
MTLQLMPKSSFCTNNQFFSSYALNLKHLKILMEFNQQLQIVFQNLGYGVN